MLVGQTVVVGRKVSFSVKQLGLVCMFVGGPKSWSRQVRILVDQPAGVGGQVCRLVKQLG